MPGGPKVWKRCEWCGRQINVFEHEVKKGHGRFCNRICAAKWMRETNYIKKAPNAGPLNGNWKGGINIHRKGYICQYAPDHPRRHNNHVLQHILIAEQKLGRPLTGSEVVHHINGNKKDNRPENLRIFPNGSEHTRHHAKLRRGEIT